MTQLLICCTSVSAVRLIHRLRSSLRWTTVHRRSANVLINQIQTTGQTSQKNTILAVRRLGTGPQIDNELRTH